MPFDQIVRATLLDNLP